MESMRRIFLALAPVAFLAPGNEIEMAWEERQPILESVELE